MGKKATVTIHPAYKIGEISPRLFGAYLEPLGSMVNGSMYNPKHPTADDKGFRRDFIDALKGTGLPAVRLPGGNFVSGWDWKDSIGPKEKRKTNLDLAWCRYEPNDVGHDEYLQWAERVGVEPLYTINLGTGNIKDAISIIEYSNHENGTYWSDLRREYGHEKPYGIKVWYLGNEMDGPWQIGSWEKNPRGYGILAHEVSKVMKWVDPTIETVACVSAFPHLRTYPQWDLEALQECYEMVDYISLHHYHAAPSGDLGALLGASEAFEDCIRTRISLSDFIQTKLRTPKKMMLSFDEYGIMTFTPQKIHYGRCGNPDVNIFYERIPKFPYTRHDPDDWDTLYIFPRQSDILEAITSMSILLTLVRHADRVRIGCMTNGLAALAATSREHVWRPAAYYPYTQLIKYCRGVSLTPAVDCDTYDIPGYAMNDIEQYDTREGVKYIECAAAYNQAEGELNVFIINRNWEQDTTLELDVRGFEGYDFIEHNQLYADDISAANSFENPDVIVPTVSSDASFRNGKVSTVVKKLSWNMFRFKKH
jgi:alpha-N-arabinofuranosidase